jgi:hypothetical protein
MHPVLATPILASGVAPELNLVTILVAAAFLAIAAWFALVSHDVATSFRRFQAMDRRPGARQRAEVDAERPPRSRPADRIEV